MILILGIVALLSVMVIAFLGTSSKQVVSTAQSHTLIQEQQLAELATTQFLADINTEILAGSVTPASAGSLAIHYPATPLSAAPDRYTVGGTASSSTSPAPPVVAPPNLIKKSAYNLAFYDKNLGMDAITAGNGVSALDKQLAFPQFATYPGSLRASAVSTGTGALSSGVVSAARWNKPLLLPRADTSKGAVFPEGYEPLTSGTLETMVAGKSKIDKWTWTPPDWIFVTKSGSTPTTWDSSLNSGSSSTAVVGRYAYQAYDVGGLLDLNVAGFSSNVVGGSLSATKGSAGLADLTVLGLTDDQLKALLAFRNPATPADSGNLNNPKANKYFNFLLRTPDPNATVLWPSNNGFMRVGSLNKLANRAFYSRQSLQAFLLGGLGAGTPSASVQAKLMDSLQSLTHFSRALEQPSYKPGFYLADSAGTRTRSNLVLNNTVNTGSISTATSPVFVRPSIVPPVQKKDDVLFPISVSPASVPTLGYIRYSGPSTPPVPPPGTPDPYVPFGSAHWNPQGDVASFRNNGLFGNFQPFEMGLGNNRGGNDAWGTLAERNGANPLGTKIGVYPSQKAGSATKTALQDVINPAFLEVRVGSKTFKRFDGTQAVSGEPLVKKRFPLERLAWITYQGPSAENGGDSLGTAENIYKVFGLVWTKATSNDPEQGNFWAYNHHGPTGVKFNEVKVGEIYTLDELVDPSATDPLLPREPDFFELLYASINVGSVGKSALSSHAPGTPYDPATYQQLRDRTSRFQVLEIGANLIDQYDSDSYPTIIKLPNPYPNPQDSFASNYYPALFTARGIEDLPYFYRLQWRAIKDNDPTRAPTFDVEAGTNNPEGPGIYEINPNAFGAPPWDSSYNCGVTSLIAYPELWNPHASNQSSSTGPTKFRVVAASQTPDDVLVTRNPAVFSGAMAIQDYGLLNNPKIEIASSSSSIPAKSMWWFLSQERNYSASWSRNVFTANLTGDFYAGLTSTSTSLQTMGLTMWGGQPFGGSPYTQNGGASSDSYFSVMSMSTLTMSGSIGTDRPYFINSIQGGTQVTKIQYPMAKIPSGVTNSNRFLSLVTSGTYHFHDFFIPSASQDIQQFAFQTNLDLAASRVDAAHWFTVPDPANPTMTNFSDSGLRNLAGYYSRSIALTNGYVPPASSSYSSPPAPTPRKWSNRISLSQQSYVDFRGTELLFDVSGTTVFREPTALCNVGSPSAAVVAGAGNFFNASPYAGSVDAGSGNGNWIGFSLGEVPSQFISAVRLERATSVVGPPSAPTTVADIYGNQQPTSSSPSYALQMLQNYRPTNPSAEVSVLDLNRTIYTGTGSGVSNPQVVSRTPINYDGTMSTSPLITGDYFRFFAVPVNVVGLRADHYMTVQVQAQDQGGNWRTYDERYIRIPGGSASQTPVLFKQQLYLSGIQTDLTNRPPPPMWRQSGQLAWGFPLVSSFDPRSSRFGHPARLARNNTDTIAPAGPPAKKFALMPSSTNPAGVSNATDRPESIQIDSWAGSSAPSVLTLNDSVPAAWNYFGTGPSPALWRATKVATPSFGQNYMALLNTDIGNIWGQAPSYPPGGAPPRAEWWGFASAPTSVGFTKVYPESPYFPSLNAYDYGWYSRAFLPQGAPLSTYSLAGDEVYGAGFSTDSVSNFMRQLSVVLTTTPSTTYSYTIRHADALRIGAFTENIQPKYPNQSPSDPLYLTAAQPEFRQAYADPDDVVRRAMGAFASQTGFSASLDGLPQAQKANVNQDNRPVVLNRAFRSVADMGYAFRGSPWRNLSFSTPETGDAALLDVFCLSDAPPAATGVVTESGSVAVAAPLVAGKVNLNTRQEKVLEALISGALKDEVKGGTMAFTSGTASEVTKAAQALIGRTTGSKAWLGPLSNVSEIAGKLFGKDISITNFNMATDPVYTSTVFKTSNYGDRNPDMNPSVGSGVYGHLNWHFTGFSADLDSNKVFTNAKDQKNLRMREAVVRALVDSGQTRVWNIMLDLIVQTGRLPSAASDLKQFVKEGEHRVWVFLAIDRLTGEVLDKIVEDVAE